MPLSHLATLRGGCDLRENKEPGTDHGPTVSQAQSYILVYHYNLSPLPYLIDAENESEREEGPLLKGQSQEAASSSYAGQTKGFLSLALGRLPSGESAKYPESACIPNFWSYKRLL